MKQLLQWWEDVRIDSKACHWDPYLTIPAYSFQPQKHQHPKSHLHPRVVVLPHPARELNRTFHKHETSSRDVSRNGLLLYHVGLWFHVIYCYSLVWGIIPAYIYVYYIYIYIIDTHTHLKSFENQFITIFGIIFGWLCCIIPILMIQDVDITRIGPMPKFEQIIQRLFSLHRWNHSIYSRWWVTPGIVNSVAHHGLNWPTYFVVWTTVEFPWIESHLEQMVFAETNQIA